MIIGIVRDERNNSLRIIQAVRLRVVRMAGIPLLLGLQPVLPVPLLQGRQSIGADPINNSDTLCYRRCEYYFSNRGQKQACYVLTGNVSTLTVSVHTSVLDNPPQNLDNNNETHFDVGENRYNILSVILVQKVYTAHA